MPGAGSRPRAAQRAATPSWRPGPTPPRWPCPAAVGLAFSTDSFVVQPRSFPGGSIGHLAVHGTVNDLAMLGARPQWLSAAFVLEEGFPMAELREVVADMAAAAPRPG